MGTFANNKIYSFDEITKICNENSLTTVDCLKDESMISVEGWDSKEKSLGGECLFEFKQVGKDKFLLSWSIFADKPRQQSAKLQPNRCE